MWTVSESSSRKTAVTSAAEFAGNGFHTSLPSHCLTASGSLPTFTWLGEKSPSRKSVDWHTQHEFACAVILVACWYGIPSINHGQRPRRHPIDTVELWQFFEDSGLACFLPTCEGLKGNELSSVRAPWRDRNQVVWATWQYPSPRASPALVQPSGGIGSTIRGHKLVRIKLDVTLAEDVSTISFLRGKFLNSVRLKHTTLTVFLDAKATFDVTDRQKIRKCSAIKVTSKFHPL
ncbi:hypothetical protein T265_07737 [Opisthorchis viverrini]|uniref:Uncharacterized protein n=1 Tax=Opisthorchis viverrini TaxID=6198 RepID=A0A075AAQ7_OPIVI|nr:hypothetical protein T265_07737 [Opisthorchis viverrini]KER24639.1 hypothetical protein T265_07737 [Opisthorchis viverrini]